MKEKPSEWIAISDLMAGLMAVVMLLLVLTVLQKSASELVLKNEIAKAKGLSENPIAKVMASLSEVINQTSAKELMALNAQTHRLTLRDGVFERGSACLTPQAKAAVQTVQPQILHFLSNTGGRIFVEGYTDNLPVKSPVTDYARFCTVYDDNFTLSAARAREARKALLGADMDETMARRVVVAGYGDSRPQTGIDPSDGRNRRVEVHFVTENGASP